MNINRHNLIFLETNCPSTQVGWWFIPSLCEQNREEILPPLHKNEMSSFIKKDFAIIGDKPAMPYLLGLLHEYCPMTTIKTSPNQSYGECGMWITIRIHLFPEERKCSITIYWPETNDRAGDRAELMMASLTNIREHHNLRDILVKIKPPQPAEPQN